MFTGPVEHLRVLVNACACVCACAYVCARRVRARAVVRIAFGFSKIDSEEFDHRR